MLQHVLLGEHGRTPRTRLWYSDGRSALMIVIITVQHARMVHSQHRRVKSAQPQSLTGGLRHHKGPLRCAAPPMGGGLHVTNCQHVGNWLRWCTAYS